MENKTLYQRLGGYDAIAAVVNELLPRVRGDQRIARYWQHRGDDRLNRSKQLLIDFLCSGLGGPVYYTGRDMVVTHQGMSISESDWSAFMEHVDATLHAFKMPQAERDDLVAFIQETKADMVEG
jgi:hemoglobin